MKNVFFLVLAIGPLIITPQSMSQGLIRTSSIWQVSSRCSLSITQKNAYTVESKPITDSKCYGISVTKGRNYNIHFYTSHPSSEKPFVSFVMAEGPFTGTHPVESNVLFLGQKEQISLPIDGGKCGLVDDNPGFAIAHCSSTTETQADGRYLLIVVTSTLDKPVALEIQKALE